jgi:hypothetical protein
LLVHDGWVTAGIFSGCLVRFSADFSHICLFPMVCSIWRLISWSFVIRRNCYRSIVREGGDSLSFFVQPSVYRQNSIILYPNLG